MVVVSALAGGVAGRAHGIAGLAPRIPGNEVTHHNRSGPALGIAASRFTERRPQFGFEPERVARVALCRHGTSICRDTRDRTTGLRWSATQSTLGVMTPTRNVGQTPFVLAEVVDPSATGASIRYTRGINTSGTGQNEVIQVVRHPDGAEHHYVIMRGLSSAKAAAIVLILNSPEAEG